MVNVCHINIDEICLSAEDYSDAIFTLSDNIFDHPEIKYQEYYAYKTLTDFIKKDSEVTLIDHVANIDTAFVASYIHKEKGKQCIAFLAEYDALANLGHGCGHNLLGCGSLLAFFITKEYMKKHNIRGEIRLYGCPAEEGGAGKSRMVKAGVFDGVQKALTWHPADYNAVTSGTSLANCQMLFTFYGKSAHAAIAPQNGRSALDACELMNVGSNYLREHIPQEVRIHYAYQNAGGTSPNIVPEKASVLYQVRAPKAALVNSILDRVKKIAQGAALMTETKVECQEISAVEEIRPCHVLEKMLYNNMKKVPLPTFSPKEIEYARVVSQDNEENTLDEVIKRCKNYPDGNTMKEIIEPHYHDCLYDFIIPYMPSEEVHNYSSDVGDVSGVCETAQFAGMTWVANTYEHTQNVVRQGKSSIAHKGILYSASVLAATALDCFIMCD